MSIVKLGLDKLILSSSKGIFPKSTPIIRGFTISSTILKLDLGCILEGSENRVFNKSSCLRGVLLYKTLIAGIN
jgi:hypothetical protein